MKEEVYYGGRYFTLKKLIVYNNITTNIRFLNVIDVIDEISTIDKNVAMYIKRELRLRAIISTINVIIDKIKDLNIDIVSHKDNTDIRGVIYMFSKIDWSKDVNFSTTMDTMGNSLNFYYFIEKGVYNDIFTKIFIKKYDQINNKRLKDEK